MTTESDVSAVENDEAINDAAMEAAFAAVDDAPEAVPVTAEPAETPAIEEKTPEAAPVVTPPAALSEDQMRLLSAIPELERRLTQQVDKVAGNYGEMKRLLDTMQKAVATPQSAANFEASADGDYLDREFPELTQGVQEKIDKALAKMPAGVSSEELGKWYEKRKELERNDQVVILDTIHPDRKEISQSVEWANWMATLPVIEQAKLNNSEDPYYVAGMVSTFKEHHAKQMSQAVKSKQRIENAVQPKGVPPKGPSTISEDDAAQKAFDAQFE